MPLCLGHHSSKSMTETSNSRTTKWGWVEPTQAGGPAQYPWVTVRNHPSHEGEPARIALPQSRWCVGSASGAESVLVLPVALKGASTLGNIRVVHTFV